MIDPQQLRQRANLIAPPAPPVIDQPQPRDHRAGSNSGFGFGIVRVATGEGKFITVTPVAPRTDAEDDLVYEAMDGKTTDMLVWPGLKARHYAFFVFTGPISDDTPIVPVMLVGGRFYVWHHVMWDFIVIEQPEAIEYSDCTPVTRLN